MNIKLITLLVASATMFGCSTLTQFDSEQEPKNESNSSNLFAVSNKETKANNNRELAGVFQKKYASKKKGSLNNKTINDYASGIMHSLINNLQYVNSNTPVAVTSFVYLDSDYQETDVLGVQLGEAFQHEVHKLGIPVVDFKAMDYIRVTPQGDMVLSKDFLDLNTEVPIRYVLSGTLVAHRNGTIVNARIIGMQSKAVVASAQGFIPLSISKDLVSSRFVDGLPLK